MCCRKADGVASEQMRWSYDVIRFGNGGREYAKKAREGDCDGCNRAGLDDE